MSVITISRDFGSEGEYIAEKVAQALGYHCVDKEFFETVLKGYGLGPLMENTMPCRVFGIKQ